MEVNGSEIVTVNDIVESLERLNSTIGLNDLEQVSYWDTYDVFYIFVFSLK